MNEDRFCRLADCGKLLVRRPGEKKQQWEGRLYCDKDCAKYSHKRSNQTVKGRQPTISGPREMVPFGRLRR